MGTKFSAFTSQSSFGATDEVVGLVGGANSRLTRKVLLQGAGTPADGQTLRYNANLATPTYETVDPRWRVLALGTDYTAAPPTTSTITVTAATVAAAPAGTPIRYKVGGSALYGIVTTSTGTTLTIAGVSISTTLTELALGTPEMVREEVLFVNSRNTSGAQVTYAAGADCLATIGFQYRRWSGPKAYCVTYRATHRTATSPVVNLKINGSNVSSTGITVSATAGTWTTVGAVLIDSSTYDINYGEDIEIHATNVAASYFLSLVATFVIA